MAIHHWEFPEESRFNLDYYAVRFIAVRGHEPFRCAVSASALNDISGAEDTRAAALVNYRTHADWVHEAAIRLIERSTPHPAGCRR